MSFPRSFPASSQGETNSVDEDEEAFAPAFASSRKSRDHAPESERTYAYMRIKNSAPTASWSTWDPETRQRKWTSSPTKVISNAHQQAPWNWRAERHQESLAKDGTQVASEVCSQFINHNEVMNEATQLQSIFEDRNKKVFGNQASAKVVSMVGNQEIHVDRKFDYRITLLNSHGNYADGINRGRPKKRHLEEQQRRLSERNEEMIHANTIWIEWLSLSPEEQATRRAEAEDNRQMVHETLEMEEIDDFDMPETYQRDFNELTLDIRAYKSQKAWEKENDHRTPASYSRTLRRNGHGKEELQSANAGATLADSQQTTLSDADLIAFTDDSQSDLIDLSDIPKSTTNNVSKKSTGRLFPRNRSRRRFRRAQQSKENRSYVNDTLLDTHSPVSSPALNTQEATESKLPEPTPLHTFVGYPSLLPPEDFSVDPLDGETPYEPGILDTLFRSCETLPRVVIIALTDPNVKYTGAAVLARVFGGALQEIQLFPQVRQAAAIFLDPRNAAAFVAHVAAAGAFSAHEYRRLQIGAAWYKGSVSAAVIPASRALLQYVHAHGASRTLRIAGIDKDISKDTLLTSLRLYFDSLQIVRAQLVKPSKLYERQRADGNAVVVEFANVSQAYRALNLIANGSVSDLEGHPVAFVPDACAAPCRPMPWCTCCGCRASHGTVASQSDTLCAIEEEDASSIVGSSTETAHRVGHREARRDASNYVAEQDLLVPDSVVYKHEDVKRPRLTRYDMAGMQRFVLETDRREKEHQGR